MAKSAGRVDIFARKIEKLTATGQINIEQMSGGKDILLSFLMHERILEAVRRNEFPIYCEDADGIKITFEIDEAGNFTHLVIPEVVCKPQK